ncbi:MAG: hypothetical protein EXQ89_03795 [Rhodospirillaceae bacterium]|nr:hypothetical protein [Rhodospirillaceae bacterium]
MPTTSTHTQAHIHHENCGCTQMVRAAANETVSRRRLFALGAGAGIAGVMGMMPFTGFAATGNYEAMLLTCIDPRFVQLHHDYMNERGLKGQYSQFVIAGGPASLATKQFADWHKAFWDNLTTSVQLHHIKKVIALSHRDCGAVRGAWGEAAVAGPEIESVTHKKFLPEFRAMVAKRQPSLIVETGIIGLDGNVELVGGVAPPAAAAKAPAAH